MRVSGGLRLLEPSDKEILRRMLWKVAAFSGVEVLAYCILSNHFHILVRVHDRSGEAVSREELLRRYRLLYAESSSPGYPDADNMAVILTGLDDEASAWESRLRARMDDVSEFMKTLNQRFSVWYNRVHRRFGTLWAERFKSVIVQDDPHCLKTVSAYIDLNPVRAGLVEDPADYRWSSYGEAMGGVRAAQAGLASVLGQNDWTHAAPDYRMVLFGKGYNGRVGEQGRISHDKVMEVLDQGGKVSLAELLRCRIRYMTEGVILGSSAFVAEMAVRLESGAASRNQVNRKRQRRPKALPIAGEQAIVSLRNIGKQPVA